MIACLIVPGFELRAALRDRPALALVPAARPRRAGPGRGGARVGGGAAAARGLGLRGRTRGAGARLLRDERRRAALRRLGGGAPAGARFRRSCLGSTRGRSATPVRRPRGGERRAARAGTRRVGRQRGGLPGTAAALAPAAPGRPLRGAGGSGRTPLGEAGRPAQGSCRGTARPGRPAGVGARARRGKRPRARTTPRGGARRGARVPGGGRERADAPPRLRLAARPAARAAGAGGSAVPQGRALGPARRRRLLAPHRDAARAHCRPRTPPRRARPAAARDPCSRLRVAAGGGRALRVGRPAARARQARRRRGAGPSERRSAPGARLDGLRLSRRRRGGGPVVAYSRDAGAVRSSRRMTSAQAAGRINAPRPALVEASPVGVPVSVDREGVALVREEWRVVDRWWTEEPLDRRYFDLVLESGRNACVFRDEEAGCWFSQRA